MYSKTIIIGTGCAGYNAADWLYNLGHSKTDDITVITEGVNMGTSRNTGSDKQTYYKLSLASDGQDSISEMAQTLYQGGSVHGDHALIEAACSAQSFMKLANLGVPFPTNEYGEYVGYKTDHDPRQRATSCGPLTSKLMTQALQKSVENKGINVVDNMQVIKLLAENNRITGLVAIDTKNYKYHTYQCDQVILATGGSAGVYYTSVYPESQTGATGLALDIGAKASNLQEWQYGLASIKFRWNVSGTYQQVLPKYIAVDPQGNEREFLLDYFTNPKNALDMVFLKGYQWPFDTAKIDGSSQIDIIIDKEIKKGNRVYMDFRTNPTGLENGFVGLADETYQYLNKSNALLETPIKRLAHMNAKAIELYRTNGIDLYNEMLEVAVCAQHQNGGIAVDGNWESSVKGLYVVGEAAGTFGVYRPGGSALNSTQVGSMRAAQHIAYSCKDRINVDKNTNVTIPTITYNETSNIIENRIKTQKLMSQYSAYIRDTEKIEELLAQFIDMRDNFYQLTTIKAEYELPHLYKNYDILITQIAVLSAILFSAKEIGTRGAGLVISTDENKDMKNHLDDVIITQGENSCFEPKRDIPKANDWFENVWNEYNKRVGI